MSFATSLWRVENDRQIEIDRSALEDECQMREDGKPVKLPKCSEFGLAKVMHLG